MSIISIDSIHIDKDNTVSVSAFIEDAVLVYPQTIESPAEYGPALCESSFDLNEELPEEDDELIDYLNSLDLDWELVDNEYDIGLTD